MTDRFRRRRRALERSLREHTFRPVAGERPPRIGAEAELIPVDTVTRDVCPIDGGSPVATMRLLREAAARTGWRERTSPKGTPQFETTGGGTLGFEPGGQLEYSSPPCQSASALLSSVRAIVETLRQGAESLGVELLAVGIDPDTPVERAPLQLHAPRYRAMAEYFATIGEFGGRMMRQTAAFQLSVDRGPEPVRLWRVLNAMAPYLTAIFANSPVYEGRPSGHASYRAHCWRMLDPLRTGTRQAAEDPVADYCGFALEAPAMFLPARDGVYAPFSTHLAAGTATEADWATHLTTLFPEVRPRGTFEIRTCDALAPEWYAAPVALIGGIAYDLAALRQADELLDASDSALLARAGRVGLADPAIAATARDLAILALDGCDALGEKWLAGTDLEVARDFFDRYTFAGRAPADDVRPVPASS